MFPTEVFRAAPFRLAVAFAASIAAVTLLLFVFIYWQTEVFETARIDNILRTESAVIAGETEPEILRTIGRQ
ncbi:MAG TPA: hypothetical protein VFN46_06645, partial [Acetobacteraceae bacterium]|nr:hypothetical protein [Acetobacteraceae bacterium]